MCKVTPVILHGVVSPSPLGRFWECSGFGIELAGPGGLFSSLEENFCFLGFMSGQEKGVCPKYIFMGLFLLLAFGLRSTEYWVASLTRDRTTLGPYIRTMPRTPWGY